MVVESFSMGGGDFDPLQPSGLYVGDMAQLEVKDGEIIVTSACWALSAEERPVQYIEGWNFDGYNYVFDQWSFMNQPKGDGCAIGPQPGQPLSLFVTSTKSLTSIQLYQNAPSEFVFQFQLLGNSKSASLGKTDDMTGQRQQGPSMRDRFSSEVC